MALQRSLLVLLTGLSLAVPSSPQTSNEDVQARIERDRHSGKPLVVHVIVALCDNKHQGIVPVPDALGNGQDPHGNLYWGALYGVRTHLKRSGYTLVLKESEPRDGVLERVVFSKSVQRAGSPLRVDVVAEAWDGRRMRQAVERFLGLAAGGHPETVLVNGAEIATGGNAALVAFVGHNGLMDFDLAGVPKAVGETPPRASIVLACASKPYFLDALRTGGSHPLLLTTGLMAPEAYTLDAALTALAEGGAPDTVREAAARAYAKYQKCGLGAARRLFSNTPHPQPLSPVQR